MTKHDRAKFKKAHGYEPCFMCWSGGGGTRICIKPKDHGGLCLAAIGVEKDWSDVACPRCDGTGRTIGDYTCSGCSGIGKVASR
jgi:RecJ-like exonuclease